MINSVRISLGNATWVDLPVTLLDKMASIDVAVKSANLPISITGKRKGGGTLKTYTVKFDEDGLLCVRGVSLDEPSRFAPVLTNTNRWVRRVTQQGLTTVEEVDLELLAAESDDLEVAGPGGITDDVEVPTRCLEAP